MTPIDSPIIIIAEYFIYISILLGIIVFVKNKSERKNIILYGAITFLIIIIITLIASNIFYDARPFVTDNVMPLILHPADNGFPSDHVLIAMGIAVVLFPFSKRFGIIAGIIAILIGVARIYAGVHHPIDIVGSILIAIGSATIGYYLFKYYLQIQFIECFD